MILASPGFAGRLEAGGTSLRSLIPLPSVSSTQPEPPQIVGPWSTPPGNFVSIGTVQANCPPPKNPAFGPVVIWNWRRAGPKSSSVPMMNLLLWLHSAWWALPSGGEKPSSGSGSGVV